MCRLRSIEGVGSRQCRRLCGRVGECSSSHELRLGTRLDDACAAQFCNEFVDELASFDQLRLEFDGEQIPEARAEAVLADWLAELDWLAQADLSQPARVAAAAPFPVRAQVAATKADEPGLAQPPAEARRLVALWERLCGVPGIWQQTLCELGVDSVQQLALLAALNEAFGQERAPLTLQTLKTHPSPSRLYRHWLVRQTEAV